jgi:signal transduction histidine kinase
MEPSTGREKSLRCATTLWVVLLLALGFPAAGRAVRDPGPGRTLRGVLDDHDPPYSFRAADGHLQGSLAAVTGLLGLLLWVWMLRRSVRGRTRELTQSQAALLRLNRELRAVSTCNQTLMRAEDESTLLATICTIVCNEAGYSMAWAGFAEHDPARTIRPVAWAGLADPFLKEGWLTWAETEHGLSPSGKAIQSGETVCIQDLATIPQGPLWLAAARQCNFRSILCLPLKDTSQAPFGSLCICSSETQVFAPNEIRLLEELAEDLAFGITVLRARREQRRAEAALRESEQQHRALLSAIPDLIFTFSRGGEYLSVHAADPGMLYGATETVLHRTTAEILPEAVSDRFLAVVASVLDTHSVQGLAYALTIGGEARHFEARLAPYAQDQIIAVVREVTEQKQAAEQQRRLQEQFQQAQKMESLGSLAGGIAHDMNNVLGAILGLASAHIETQPPASPTHKAFAVIIRAAERGGKMVQSLLNFARQTPAEARGLDANELLRDAARLLERTTLASVQLELDLAPDLALLTGDPGALTHAFMNLCVNAVDAMQGKGRLIFRTRNLGPGWIEIQVEDSGIGMTREVLARAMDPFYTTKPPGKGTGLGLSMVYSTVTAHKGQLELQSTPGRGTLVQMRFPVGDPASGQARPEAEARPVAAQGGAGRGGGGSPGDPAGQTLQHD